MKKTILLLFFVSIFLLVTGCKKDEVEAIPDETTSGGWEIILSSDQIVSNNDALEAYNKAKEIYVDEDFDLVALLAKQIVAGTNYMYLVKNEKEYKILVVYNDLDGNAIVNSLTKLYCEAYQIDFESEASKMVDWVNQAVNSNGFIVLQA